MQWFSSGCTGSRHAEACIVLYYMEPPQRLCYHHDARQCTHCIADHMQTLHCRLPWGIQRHGAFPGLSYGQWHCSICILVSLLVTKPVLACCPQAASLGQQLETSATCPSVLILCSCSFNSIPSAITQRSGSACSWPHPYWQPFRGYLLFTHTRPFLSSPL
jgi:hypothetical protein